MKGNQISAIGAILSSISVVLGAFGAHGLESVLDANGRTDTFATAMDYWTWHSIGLVILGLVGALPDKTKKAVLFFFIAGILLFSGSLIALSITGIEKFGIIAPIGGLSFIIGWAYLGLRLWKAKDGASIIDGQD